MAASIAARNSAPLDVSASSWVSVSNAQSCYDRPSINNVHSYLEIDSLNIPAGEEFTFWQFPQKDYLGSPVGWSVKGPLVNASLPEISLKLGIVSDVARYGDCTTDVCVDSSECPEGEKCVNGECVPCDEQQASHFQIRAEFEELVTLPDGSQTVHLLSSVYPIGSGVSNQIIQLAECNGAWVS